MTDQVLFYDNLRLPQIPLLQAWFCSLPLKNTPEDNNYRKSNQGEAGRWEPGSKGGEKSLGGGGKEGGKGDSEAQPTRPSPQAQPTTPSSPPLTAS